MVFLYTSSKSLENEILSFQKMYLEIIFEKMHVLLLQLKLHNKTETN